jgi:hypothetical protein
MESMNKQVSMSAQSWTSRVERKHLPKVEYYSELRSWVQCVILKAEKNKDFNKKDQFLSLLKDL